MDTIFILYQAHNKQTIYDNLDVYNPFIRKSLNDNFDIFHNRTIVRLFVSVNL